jgi:AcrR family transcriptional regulator
LEGVGKGELTRQAILERAVALTSQVGLRGLTIGGLAKALSLSKSGLFAHFQSKEALQVQVLQYAAERFVDEVVRPALKAPRGEARVRALFERWLGWENASSLPGGCPFLAATTELDDVPGPPRDQLLRSQKDWLELVANCFRVAIGEGHFSPLADPDQFAQDLQGVILAYHFSSRLLGDPLAKKRAQNAFEALVESARGDEGPRASARGRTADAGVRRR